MLMYNLESIVRKHVNNLLLIERRGMHMYLVMVRIMLMVR